MPVQSLQRLHLFLHPVFLFDEFQCQSYRNIMKSVPNVLPENILLFFTYFFLLISGFSVFLIREQSNIIWAFGLIAVSMFIAAKSLTVSMCRAAIKRLKIFEAAFRVASIALKRESCLCLHKH